MKHITKYGQLIEVSESIKKAYGRLERCLVVTLNGQESFAIGRHGLKALSRSEPPQITLAHLDPDSIDLIEKALDQFILKKNLRQLRLNALSA